MNDNTLPRYWLVRLYLALSLVILCVTALLQTGTQLYRQVSADGGGLYVITLGAISLIGALDAIVNDMLPDRWRLPWARRHRHVIYMLMAIGSFSIAYMLIIGAGMLTGASAQLILNTLVATLIAFLDLFSRHRP